MLPLRSSPSPAPGRAAGRRILAVLALTGLGIGLGVGTASAHVTVNPGAATAGSYTKLTFRVPNESATAKTDRIVVTFPLDTPFASVSVKKVPGWTVTAQKTTLPKPVPGDDNTTVTQAVTKVTWQADAADAIGLGEFAEFDVSVGPVPGVRSISFPTQQHYTDGAVVNWDEPTPASGAEPEHPAPTLTVTPAAGGASGGETAAPPAASVSAPADTPTVIAAQTVAAPDKADNAARVLGVIGIVVGAFGLLIGAVGLRRRASSK